MPETYVEDYIQVPPDGTGKKVRAIKRPDNRYEEVTVPLSKDGDVDLTTLANLLNKLTQALASIAKDSLITSGSEKKPLAQRPNTNDLYAQLRHGGKEIDPRDVNREGATWTDFNLTESGDIVSAPGAGYKLQLFMFYFSSDADIVTSLRWGATGADMFPLQQKGAVGMNLIGAKVRESPENVSLYGYLSGAGTMKGSVLTKKVPV